MSKKSDVQKTRANKAGTPPVDESLAKLAKEKWDLRHETWAQLVKDGMMPESDFQLLKQLAGVE